MQDSGVLRKNAISSLSEASVLSCQLCLFVVLDYLIAIQYRFPFNIATRRGGDARRSSENTDEEPTLKRRGLAFLWTRIILLLLFFVK